MSEVKVTEVDVRTGHFRVQVGKAWMETNGGVICGDVGDADEDLEACATTFGREVRRRYGGP